MQKLQSNSEMCGVVADCCGCSFRILSGMLEEGSCRARRTLFVPTPSALHHLHQCTIYHCKLSRFTKHKAARLNSSMGVKNCKKNLTELEVRLSEQELTSKSSGVTDVT